jgi:hypothetical protein
MRRGTLESDLIQSIGHEHGVLEIEYSDHTIFQYFEVPFAVFKKIVLAKSPGKLWLSLRDKFKHKEVEN